MCPFTHFLLSSLIVFLYYCFIHHPLNELIALLPSSACHLVKLPYSEADFPALLLGICKLTLDVFQLRFLLDTYVQIIV